LKKRLLISLSRLTDFDEASLVAGHQQAAQVAYTPATSSVSPSVRKSQTTSPVEKLFRLLARFPELASEVPENLNWQLVEDPLLPSFLPILSYLQKNPGTTPQVLLAYWTGTQQGEDLWQRARLALELNKEAVAREIQAICSQLQAQQGEKSREQRYHELLQAMQVRELADQEHQELAELMKHLPPNYT